MRFFHMLVTTLCVLFLMTCKYFDVRVLKDNSGKIIVNPFDRCPSFVCGDNVTRFGECVIEHERLLRKLSEKNGVVKNAFR